MIPEFNIEDFPGMRSVHADAKDGVVDARPYIPEFKPLTAMDLNLETELLDQYNRARKLLHDASYDDEIPLNQKAMALNATTTIIGALIRSQAELYSLEKVKKIESTIIECLRKYPDLQEDFLKSYEVALNAS